jgi:predicted transposase YbfD/YdcC
MDKFDVEEALRRVEKTIFDQMNQRWFGAGEARAISDATKSCLRLWK